MEKEYLRIEALKAGLVDPVTQPKSQLKAVERRIQEAINLKYVGFLGGGGRGDPYRFHRTPPGTSAMIRHQAVAP